MATLMYWTISIPKLSDGTYSVTVTYYSYYWSTYTTKTQFGSFIAFGLQSQCEPKFLVPLIIEIA